MKTLEVRLTFIEEVLGTNPNDEELFRRFIGDKAPDAQTIEEEVADLGVDEVFEKGITVFPRDEDGKPFIYDYQVKGFMKDTAKMLKKVSGTKSGKIKAYRQDIDGLIFPNPRKIPFEYGNTDVGLCQRPLRASTPMGERIALAASEKVPAGATVEFEINILVDEYVDWVREMLDYGRFRGIGQWRNSGKGRFTWEELRCY